MGTVIFVKDTHFPVKGQKTSNPGQNPGHRGIQDRTQKKRTVLGNPGQMVTLARNLGDCCLSHDFLQWLPTILQKIMEMT